MPRALVFAPKSARRGDVIEIRTLIAHPMETGQRTDADGHVVPRDIIRKLECRYEGELVFSAELFAAIAANPLVAFHTLATTSGTISIAWSGDNGFAQTENVAISVE